MSRVFWNIQQAIFRGPVKRTCGRVGGKHANGEIYVVLPSFRVGPYSFPAAPAVEDLAVECGPRGNADGIRSLVIHPVRNGVICAGKRTLLEYDFTPMRLH